MVSTLKPFDINIDAIYAKPRSRSLVACRFFY